MKVLLATDGSELAVEAAKFLSRLPHADPLALTVNTTVMIPVVQTAGETSALPDEFLQAQASVCQGTLSANRAVVRGRRCHAHTQHHAGARRRMRGRPSGGDGAELIVVGAKGHSMVHRILLGSISEYIATHAKCSVLIVRPSRSESPQLKSHHCLRCITEIRSCDQAVFEFSGAPKRTCMC